MIINQVDNETVTEVDIKKLQSDIISCHTSVTFSIVSRNNKDDGQIFIIVTNDQKIVPKSLLTQIKIYGQGTWEQYIKWGRAG
jgi:hypothetical protein